MASTELHKGASPADVRRIFGDNLRQLLGHGHSISQTCRDIGIHRSQFNRYLTGHAFPKPDVLQRICTYFDTDARIFLEPLSRFATPTMIEPKQVLIGIHPELQDYLKFRGTEKETSIMPCGFYRLFRHSYIDRAKFQSSIIYVYMRDGFKFHKGFLNRPIARELGIRIHSSADREFRGAVLGTDTGVFTWAAHRGSKSLTVNYLEVRTIVDKTFLYGYCARTMSKIGSIPPVSKTIFEKLPNDYGHILRTARATGLLDASELPAFYKDMMSFE